MVKPDGVQRGLVGEVIGRLERRGLKLVAAKLTVLERALVERHYGHLSSRPFYPELIRFMSSSPSMVMVWEGRDAIAAIRATMGGATNPLHAPPGTIRGDLALDIGRNVIHSSDRTESTEKEIALWFQPGEILEYTRAVDPWVIEEI